MIPRDLLLDARVQAALAALGLGIAALLYAAFGAIRVEDSHSPMPDSRLARAVSSLTRMDTTSDALLDRAVDRDPFATEQAAPAVREPVSSPVTLAASAPLRLVGTVVDGASGDFALCQLGGDAPKIVRVGQTIGSYTLRSVTQGAASFDSPSGNRLDLRVAKTGS